MKKLTFEEGNLLTHTRVQAIGHQANCQNTFGSGIARAIKEMYSEAYEIDCISAAKKKNTLGLWSAAEIPLVDGYVNRHGNKISRIYNLYGQNLGTIKGLERRVRMTDYEALYSALESVADSLNLGGDKMPPIIGFPYLMGSDLGGGRWEIVQRLIEVAFDGYENEVIIVKLKK
jgi:O-acetyl-ADP-ribose deacetylase (regulator of RNase III)